MARRFSAPYQSEPFSALATWARRLALFSAVAALVSIVVVRFGFLEMKPALRPSSAHWSSPDCRSWWRSRAFATLAQRFARHRPHPDGAAVNVLILAYPAYLAVKYHNLPAIHDITTDPINPPQFEALARLRGADGANTAVYAGLYSAEQQRAAYPEIEPVELDVPAQQPLTSSAGS